VSLRVDDIENSLDPGRHGSILAQMIGLGVHAGKVDGPALCRMFNHAIWGQRTIDQLFLFERRRADLRILDLAEIKTVPYVLLSHPFAERLAIRREHLGRTLFWTRVENQRFDFRSYFNGHRAHSSLKGRTPNRDPSDVSPFAGLHSY